MRWFAVLLLIIGSASTAHAQVNLEIDQLRTSSAPDRVFGLGTAIGFGGAAAVINSTTSSSTIPFGFALELPSLEMNIYLDEGTSIDISIPISNIALVSAIFRAFVFQTTVYLDFSVGDDVRFIGGPGLGFTAIATGSLGGFGLRFAGMLGLEVLTPNTFYGFRVMTRPFIETSFVSDSVVVGGGALLELVSMFNVTQ